MKVFLIAAISVDGFIGLDSDHYADWTSKEDKKFFVELTKQAGVMVMGANTFKTIGRGLPGRKTLVYSPDTDAFKGAEGDVQVTNEEPQVLIQRLKQEGYAQVAICGGGQIYSLFLKSGLVTDLFLTVEPVLFGQGIPLGANAPASRLRLEEQRMLNDQTLMLHYSVTGLFS